MKLTTYERVIPRDLFNESKLLKCIGRVSLLILDKVAPEGLTINHEGGNFDIQMNENDGGIFISNVIISHNSTTLFMQTTMNSKDNYPLICRDVNDEEYYVFDDDGKFTVEFTNFLNTLAA